ncbi:MAG TPA: DUF4123 domain-containing protein [Chitinispirillaceae bacterium]|nr:DUF4123 domain-containing protein [Chitinispirillaceae bacterium]
MTISPAKSIDYDYLQQYLATVLEKYSDHKLYSIIDCAQSNLLYKMLIYSNAHKACLYKKNIHYPGERMTEELAAVAPYIVELRPDEQLTANLLYRGWGKSWFIFLISDQTLETVYEHCSDNLLALTDGGETLLFRYYDASILKAYLPTCTSAELSIFFGPVKAICVEDEESRQPILFGYNRKQLSALLPDGKTWKPAYNLFASDETDNASVENDIDDNDEITLEKPTIDQPVKETESNEETVNPQTITLIPNAQLNWGPDKYNVESPVIDCKSRGHLCKRKCCTLIFALTEQDVREGIVKWDPKKPYQILRDEKRYCVHLIDGECSIYDNRPGVCRRMDCRSDRRMWMDFENCIPFDS